MFEITHLNTTFRISFLMDDKHGLAVDLGNKIYVAPGQWLHIATTLTKIKEPYQWLFNTYGLTDETLCIAITYGQFLMAAKIDELFGMERNTASRIDKWLRAESRPLHPILDAFTLPYMWPSGLAIASRLFRDAKRVKAAAQDKAQQPPGHITHLPLSLSHDILSMGDFINRNKEKILDSVGIPIGKLGRPNLTFDDLLQAHLNRPAFYVRHPDSVLDLKSEHACGDVCDAHHYRPSHWQLFRRWIKKVFAHALHNRKNSD